jgi:tetratricopeptide (TPR) repeat protein
MQHTEKIKQGKTKTGNVFRILAYIALILATLYGVRFSLHKHPAFSDKLSPGIIAGRQTDPDALVETARREHFTGNLDKAMQLYVQAIDSFTLHAPAWLGLVELLRDRGEEGKATAAMRTLDSLDIVPPDLLWRKAYLARDIRLGNILLSTLRELLQHDPASSSRIFDLAGEFWQDPQTLMQKFSPGSYPDILRLYIRDGRPEEAQAVWREIRARDLQDVNTTAGYVSFLLDNNKFEPAVSTWRTSIQNNGNLLFNGNFEKPILNAAFGWHATRSQEIDLLYGDFGGGLTITFAGTGNPAFSLSQVVPVYPGEHVFRGAFETNQLTSQQRPYWLISGYNCQGLYIEDTMLPASEYRTEFAVPFVVPDSCQAVRIELVRKKASPFDSFISGSVSLSGLEVRRLSPLPAQTALEVARESAGILGEENQPEKTAAATDVAGKPGSSWNGPERASEKGKEKTTIFIHGLIIRP